jgi:hypothetical protein
VVGHAEEVLPASVAREQQRATRVVAGEQGTQVLVGSGSVTHVELHRLADAHFVADRERARFGVGADHIAYEEVAASELGLVLIDDETDVQTVTDQLVSRRSPPSRAWSRTTGCPASSSTRLRSVTTKDAERTLLRHHRGHIDAVVNTPTAPVASTWSSSTVGCHRDRAAADAAPPITWRPGRSSSSCRGTLGGKLYGSVSKTKVPGSWSSSGQPVIAWPSGVSSSESDTGSARPAYRRRTATLRTLLDFGARR